MNKLLPKKQFKDLQNFYYKHYICEKYNILQLLLIAVTEN